MATIPACELSSKIWRWKGWLTFSAGVVVGCSLPILIAFYSGPKSTTVFEDPVTGRSMYESVWIGLTLSKTINENDISKWADLNSIPSIYPARFGWTAVSSETRDWFSGTMTACGGGHHIPDLIFRGYITVEGLTPEETLKTYQTELTASFYELGSTTPVLKKWAAKQKAR